MTLIGARVFIFQIYEWIVNVLKFHQKKRILVKFTLDKHNSFPQKSIHFHVRNMTKFIRKEPNKLLLTTQMSVQGKLGLN
jgi:hypothetical protein